MRILIISDAWHPQTNGVVRTYEHLCAALEKRGHKTRVIGPSDFPRQASLWCYPEIKIPFAPYKKLSRMIDDFAPDSIHIATEGALGWAARRYCRRRGVKFTTCYHTNFPDYIAKRVAKVLPFLYGATHRAARKFIHTFHKPSSCVFVATKTLERTLNAWGFNMPMARLVRGVDVDIFHPAPSDILKTHTRPIALYVGRIAIEKNLDAFFDMDWTGTKVLVGDGPDLKRLKQKYPNAVFAGKQTGTTLADYYRASDIFVFPSKTDTFGLVLIEALACGLPVAAYPVMGPIDIINQNYLGALDSDLTRAAQNALILKKDLKSARADHIKQTYTWAAVALQFETAINAAEKT